MSAQECSMLTAMRSGSSSPTITDASNLMMRFKPVDGECDAATDVRCGGCCCWRWWWRLHLCVTCTPSLMTAAHRKRRQVRWPSSCFFERRHVFPSPRVIISLFCVRCFIKSPWQPHQSNLWCYTASEENSPYLYHKISAELSWKL